MAAATQQVARSEERCRRLEGLDMFSLERLDVLA
jgi:hypothetical protein